MYSPLDIYVAIGIIALVVIICIIAFIVLSWKARSAQALGQAMAQVGANPD